MTLQPRVSAGGLARSRALSARSRALSARGFATSACVSDPLASYPARRRRTRRNSRARDPERARAPQWQQSKQSEGLLADVRAIAATVAAQTTARRKRCFFNCSTRFFFFYNRTRPARVDALQQCLKEKSCLKKAVPRNHFECNMRKAHVCLSSSYRKVGFPPEISNY